MEIRNHPLAGQGTAFYGALKPGKVTVARFCNIDGAYKLFLLRGEAVALDRCTTVSYTHLDAVIFHVLEVPQIGTL